ncbi:MAG TPA: serine/threonine-protein kinase [Polyangiaceae bacterium]|nr:serine/threonine-protein kinase [Polyangiaceae bacterium]
MSDRDPKNRSREGRPLGEPVRFGPFVLHKRIAVGGMSEVYLARPAHGVSPAPEFVIKRLLPSVLDDPRSRRTFEIEASLHGAARHPNVVEVFEAGEVDGEPYLAMEYVVGADTFRVMRRAQSEGKPLPPSIGVYVARELCQALSCVHHVTDDAGNPFGIVHRDVTPSNIYLSHEGDVKLGDFGIARSVAEKPRVPGSQALKGKYGYLAPEQVSGDPFDHRADLFSLAVVLSEMIIGQPLFPGAGQLAVLLAIRDCRIDPLRAAHHLLPSGLFPVLEKALAKAPDDRFASADELYEALGPYEIPGRAVLKGELAKWVQWASDPATLAKRIEGAIRESTKIAAVRLGTPLPQRAVQPGGTIPPPQAELANVRMQDGRTLSDVPFAKVVEYIVTGELAADDEVAMAGVGFRRVDAIEVLARHLPPSTATTSRLDGPGVPDYAAELATTSMLEVLGWLLVRRETGALFADRSVDAPVSVRTPASSRASRPPGSQGARKELYLDGGRLILVASSEASELLGEYLVRQGAIDRGELEMALLALPRYEGRLGDTLIGLGLVDPVDVFRAIQNQGRARVADIFRWSTGRASFYRGVKPSRVEFRLDLDIPELMMAGLQEAIPDETMLDRHRHEIDANLQPVRPPPAYAMLVAWPPAVLLLMGALGSSRPLKDLLDAMKTRSNVGEADALRALEVAVHGGLIKRPAGRRWPTRW